MQNSDEFKSFERLTRGILSVPHAEVKAKLDAEKKAQKRKKSKVSSVSRAGGDKD